MPRAQSNTPIVFPTPDIWPRHKRFGRRKGKQWKSKLIKSQQKKGGRRKNTEAVKGGYDPAAK